MNSGKYVFAQILTFVNRWEFDKCVERYNGDYWTRELTCWNLFVQLLFGQLTSLNSLRDICLCLKAHKNKLYHLGIKQNVTHSSLSRANESRDWRIFADFGQYLISIVQPLFAAEKIPDIYAENQVFALDSTTISLSIKLFTWAFGKYSRGAVKVHTILNLRGSIPTFIHISHGKYHDSNVLDFMPIERDTIYVMDKAYVDFAALYEMELVGAFFVTRAKENMVFEVIETNGNDIAALVEIFDAPTADGNKPRAVIAHTNKGHPISYMSDNVAWHHKVPSDEQYAQAIAELEALS